VTDDFCFLSLNSTDRRTSVQAKGLQTTACGPNPVREAISPGPRRHFVIYENRIHLWKTCWFARM